MKKSRKYIIIVFILLIIIISALFYYKNTILMYIDMYKNYNKTIATVDPSKDETNNTLNEDNVTEDYVEYRDVEYKNTDGNPLYLDIYKAKKNLEGGNPVILYVHGGSWIYGNKDIPDEISPMLDSFRDRGFTIISTSYELMKDEEIFYKQISDIKDTLRWINKNKEKYEFNTDEIGVIGTSAGAHLAMMAAYSGEKEFKGDANLEKYPSKVRYLIDCFGPTDLTTLNLQAIDEDERKIADIILKNKSEDTFKLYSPINIIKEDMPSTLIIHSKKDDIVPYINTEKLYDKLKEYGNSVQLLTLENSKHDLEGIEREEVVKVATKMLTFIINNSPL